MVDKTVVDELSEYKDSWTECRRERTAEIAIEESARRKKAAVAKAARPEVGERVASEYPMALQERRQQEEEHDG